MINLWYEDGHFSSIMSGPKKLLINLKEALEELGGVERMDDTGVVLRVNVGHYLDELEEDVYEEISDRCDEKMECMFDEMMGEWIDKPDFSFNDNYYS